MCLSLGETFPEAADGKAVNSTDTLLEGLSLEVAILIVIVCDYLCFSDKKVISTKQICVINYCLKFSDFLLSASFCISPFEEVLVLI